MVPTSPIPNFTVSWESEPRWCIGRIRRKTRAPPKTHPKTIRAMVIAFMVSTFLLCGSRADRDVGAGEQRDDDPSSRAWRPFLLQATRWNIAILALGPRWHPSLARCHGEPHLLMVIGSPTWDTSVTVIWKRLYKTVKALRSQWVSATV